MKEFGSETLTPKSVRLKLEQMRGLEPNALKSKKEMIARLIDDVLAEIEDADRRQTDCRQTVEELRNLASDAAGRQTVVDERGQVRIVAAMEKRDADVEVQRHGCAALWNIALGDAACKQAVVDARGLEVIVAAMKKHPTDVEVQQKGCGALWNIAIGDDATRKQAVVGARGLEAIVAAMKKHPTDVEVQRRGCAALRNIARGDAARKHAVLGAGGLDALVAAGNAVPKYCHSSVSMAVRDLLSNLGPFTPGQEPPPPPPQPPPPGEAELARAQQARQRAERREQQEREQREEEDSRRVQAEQGLRARLKEAQKDTARLQAEMVRLQALEVAAMERLTHAKDSSEPGHSKARLSVAAGPLTHYNRAYQSAHELCYTAVEIWSAERHVTSPFDAEVEMLRKLWADGGRGRREPDAPDTLPMGYTLSRIEAVDVPSSARQTFYNLVEIMETRRDTGVAPGPFNPAYPSGDRNGEKAAVLAQLFKSGATWFVPRDKLRKQNILLVLHGCSKETADRVCKEGFANITYRDKPWFGHGLYTTTYAEYACHYATGEFKSNYNQPNDAGEYVLLAAFAAPGMVYPVSRATDYSRPSVLTSSSKLRDRALQPQFNSHYAFVSAQNNYQCMDGARKGVQMDYDELVCRDTAQLLPAYRLFFRWPSKP